MIKIYGLEYTYYDHPGKYSLVLYTNGCNLRCYGCHNRHLSGWDYEDTDYQNKMVVDHNLYYKQISQSELEISIKNEMLDMIILCGGEFLIYSIDDIKLFIDYIKECNPSILIRIDTNGTFPDKILELLSRGKVDGFAIDIKGPYWDRKYQESICEVIGIPVNVSGKMFDRMVESLHLAKQLPYTLYRTVMYPVIQDKQYFDEIKQYVHENLGKPHSFNTFVKV